MEFTDWLIKKKGLTKRSAQDVQSRVNRLMKMSPRFSSLSQSALTDLISNESTSVSVKSQLKRAAVLFTEFKK